MLGSLTKEHFEPFLGGVFKLRFENSDLSLILKKITDENAYGTKRPQRDPFSLFFIASTELPLNQGTYALAHPEFGVIQVFLVPVDQEEKGGDTRSCYQAIFN